MIREGKDKGQTGTIIRVYRKQNRVLVEGRNIVKRHIKRQENQPGAIITKEAPLHVSNVQILDPVTKAPVKISWKFLEDGTKVRVSRGKLASQSILPKSPLLFERRKPLPTTEDGLSNTTTLEVVKHQSYQAEDSSRLLAEALKNLALEEDMRPKDQPPKHFIPGYNTLPASISLDRTQELFKILNFDPPPPKVFTRKA
eukprot:CAMPEP_0196580872 /NCGR_PEP_ID=MMETSP1081-20130531/31148_1 /TAXON_ID=36882 /ORGANISM="Pyramimonas amylifera, Strain CCMP720" /LENGTH=198 /DNA_ID=CAMNT_0041900889 /DNA_START=219 /DNA_END=815 /DNA_ORIENTATION=-